jgi:hypothetical protein
MDLQGRSFNGFFFILENVMYSLLCARTVYSLRCVNLTCVFFVFIYPNNTVVKTELKVG